MSSPPEKALYLNRPHRHHYHKAKPRRPRWSWLWWFAAAVAAFVVGRTTAPQSVSTPVSVPVRAAIKAPDLKTEITTHRVAKDRATGSENSDQMPQTETSSLIQASAVTHKTTRPVGTDTQDRLSP